MSQQTAASAAQYPAALVETLDELTYKRFRKETNQSHSYTEEDARHIHQLVSTLWRVPKAGPGDIVAGAQLEAIIGKGAFGTVWKATELASGALRAVKIFDADRLGDGMAVHLFRRGVRAMQYLRQQNDEERSQGGETQELSKYIVPICQVEPHLLAFSMNWLSGGDLSSGTIRGRTIHEKLRLFRHIARAIHYAHTRPSTIVHRDIKPQNIVMDGDIPILTDFDIADMAFAKTLSRRAVGGAFAYAAPEQLSGTCEHLELRSDIYSLGRLLHFFLLEQDPPLLIERIPPLDDLNDYPEGIVKIIRRCTHRDLPMRYASVAELLDELDHYEKAEQVGAYGPNLVLAQRHWEQAEQHAAQRLWEVAQAEAAQAQAYLKGVDAQRSQTWSFREKTWRFRAGEWLLGPTLAYLWFQRLSWPLAFGLLLLLLSPLGLLAGRAISQQAKGEALEGMLQQLLRNPSLDSLQSQRALSYIKETPSRIATTRRRLAVLFGQASTAKGGLSCRYLELLYRLAPRSHMRLLHNDKLNQKQESRAVFLHLILGTESRQWGPIRCKPGQALRGMKFTPHKAPSLRLAISFRLLLPRADLRALFARRVSFSDSDFRGSDLSYASLRECILTEAVLTDAVMDLADFRGARISHLTAVRSSFLHADLRGADASRSDFSHADFRKARFHRADLRYSKFKGALLSADARVDLMQGHIDPRYWQQAICLSGGIYLMQGHASRCYRWHRDVDKRLPGSRPPHCPKTLQKFSMLLSFPPRQLRREGICPWQEKSLDAIAQGLPQPQTRSAATTQPTTAPAPSRPTSQPRRNTP